MQRCRLAFRVQSVSWKIGLKAELVAKRRLCHIWYYFLYSLSCSLFLTQTVSTLSLMLECYIKIPPHQTFKANNEYTILNLVVRNSSIMRHSFSPYSFSGQNVNILSLKLNETHSGTHIQKENESKMNKTIYCNFEHVTYT